MAGHFKEVLIILATAGIAVPFLQRLKLSPVLGFLLVGLLVGPSGLGRLFSGIPILSEITISQSTDIALVGELGIVFLLFVIGLELSFERLWTMRRYVFGLGSAQVVASAAAIAGLLAIAGTPPVAALVLGLALGLSSTAIVVEVLSRQKRFASTSGRVAFSVLLLQDLAVVPILMVVTALGTSSDGPVLLNLIYALGQSLIVMGVIVALGRLALRPLFRLVAGAQSTELFMAATMFIVIATAVATAAAGLSMALGAFVAGLLLAETEFRREIATIIEPFKGLLLGVFFMTVGMGIDLQAVLGDPTSVLVGAVALVVIKSAIIWGLATWWFGVSRGAALEAALLLGPGGEFAFVVLGLAAASGVVPGELSAMALAAVSITMAMIPLMSRLGSWGSPKIQRPELTEEARELPPEDSQARAIIVGYGRVGQLIGQMLEASNIPFIASDVDMRGVSEARRGAKPVYYGDASRAAFLRQCGIGNARALIITVGSSRIAEEVVRAARSVRPDIVIVARARDAAHAGALYRLGVTVAVPETIEASLQLSEAALVGLGVPMGKAIAATHEKRDIFRKALQERYETTSGG